MNFQRVKAIAMQDLRVLRTESLPVMVLVVMPLVLMPFLRPAFEVALRVEGLAGATGAEQVVPGMTVTFGFFLVANLGFAFFREHSWHTWERLRSSPANSLEILLGKMVGPFVQAGVQFVLLFGLGCLLMGLRVEGSWLSLVAVGIAFSLNLICTGLAVISICRTFMQVNALVNVAALLFAGLSGALVPFGLLPVWARAISPAIPSYWAMEGYKRAILGGSVLGPILVLLSYAAFATALALWRFRFADTKVGLV